MKLRWSWSKFDNARKNIAKKNKEVKAHSDFCLICRYWLTSQFARKRSVDISVKT